MTSTEIRTAYGAGQTELIDKLACEVMHEDAESSHQEVIEVVHDGKIDYKCRYCGDEGDGKKHHHCTRYTTDLTSAAELETKVYGDTKLWRRFIVHSGIVELWNLATGETTLFAKLNEALNRTTAALYAMAWEQEQQKEK